MYLMNSLILINGKSFQNHINMTDLQQSVSLK